MHAISLLTIEITIMDLEVRASSIISHAFSTSAIRPEKAMLNASPIIIEGWMQTKCRKQKSKTT
jgi:hypothetical protein